MGYFIEDHIGSFDEQPRISDQINRAGPLGCFFRLKKEERRKRPIAWLEGFSAGTRVEQFNALHSPGKVEVLEG